MKPDLVVCCYQSKHISAVLQAIEAQREDLGEIFLVEDGEEIPNIPVPSGAVWLTHKHEGFGLSKSCNQGIGASTAEYVYLIEGDEILPEGVVRDNMILAKPQTLSCLRKVYVSEDDLKTVIEGDHRDEENYPMWGVWANCSGGHLLIHRPSHIEIGGFDEEYEYGLHDYDYAVRWMSCFGWDSVRFGGKPIHHIGSGKGRPKPPQQFLSKFYAVLHRELGQSPRG